MIRRIFICLLTVIVLANTVVFADESDSSDWAAAEVAEAIRLEFIPEHMQKQYTTNITRAEFAEIAVYFLALQFRVDVHEVYSYHEAKFDENWNRVQYFTDVQNIFVDAAFQFGIVNGRGNGIFDPDSPITREEAAQMLYNTYLVYAKIIDESGSMNSLECFADCDMISAWAAEAAAFVAKYGVMNGISEEEFSPKGYYTREQCYLTFLRLYKNAPCSRLYGTANQLLTYENMVNEIINMYSYELLYTAETDTCGIFYGVQTAARVGGYSFWIVYKDGGRKNLWELFPRPYYLYLEDFSFNADKTVLYCTQTKTGQRCRIDLDAADVVVVR